jgi:hypothetical protein
MRRKNFCILTVVFGTAVFSPTIGWAQLNSGSDGSDSAFNPTTNTVINMADHPTGIYQYTTVNIPSGVKVTFIPNVNNSPVTWLVQSNVAINGTVDVSGQDAIDRVGNLGGPGGWSGGNGGSNATFGQGPGGGATNQGGSYGSAGANNPSPLYGNSFLLPLLGGSGGSGDSSGGGGGGGGAILIAASNSIQVNGTILANGGQPGSYGAGYGGSGGGIRLVTPNFFGSGSLSASGGGSYIWQQTRFNNGGNGRIRIDAFQNNFGNLPAFASVGFQPIIIPAAGQGVQLIIASIAGASVTATPNGQLDSPDAFIPGQQANPIPIVVNCSNLPLNTPITVTVKPASGSSVSAMGYNTAGTLASSTATVSIVMPRGGGIIYATAATSN